MPLTYVTEDGWRLTRQHNTMRIDAPAVRPGVVHTWLLPTDYVDGIANRFVQAVLLTPGGFERLSAHPGSITDHVIEFLRNQGMLH